MIRQLANIQKNKQLAKTLMMFTPKRCKSINKEKDMFYLTHMFVV